jgi:hypothetical protein
MGLHREILAPFQRPAAMKAAGKIRFVAKLTAWMLFACGVFVFIALGDNKYAWMPQMDPSMALPPDDASGDRAIFALLLLLAAIVASQLALLATAAHRREKAWAAVLALTTIVLWSSRFWR